MGEFARAVLVTFEWVVLGYFVLVNTVYLLLLLSAAREMCNHLLLERAERRWRVLQSDIAPTVSMLAPAYDEAPTIAASVGAMLGLSYPNLEVVVVNDGSGDETLQVLIDNFALVAIHPVFRRQTEAHPVAALYRSTSHPNLVVVDKENGGKADALNAGLNVAGGRLVCALDADTIIEPEALTRMVRPFVSHDDVVAAGGTIRIVNGSDVRHGRVVELQVPRRALAGFQVVEYLRAFRFGRLGWNRLGGNLIISGAFGLFDRQAMADAGGYTHDTVGEDMELVVRLRRRSYEQKDPKRVSFIPDPVAWTEVPESLRVLGRQRDRWHRGLADALHRHRRLFLNPRYRAMGLFVYPYFVVVELLAPLVEALGLLGLAAGLLLGAVDMSFAILFFLLAYGLGIVLAAFTLALEELSFHRYERLRDRAWLVMWALLESLGYRQLTVLWRIRGIWKFLRGRTDWGVMKRRGFAPANTPEG
jgi:cellulose synthase/poly-beta-1,6-N-acetylglucosamine synthase-like glycosyltransferase